MNNPTNRRTVENWQTVALTALPHGWVNVFKDRRGAHFTAPCPGVLLQESTSVTEYFDRVDGTGHTIRCSEDRDEPRTTRVVYADNCGEDFGEITAVTELDGQYQFTTTAEYWTARQGNPHDADRKELP